MREGQAGSTALVAGAVAVGFYRVRNGGVRIVSSWAFSVLVAKVLDYYPKP